MGNEKKELLYDGVYYDVTKWLPRHPGGKIMELYLTTGEDSIHAVQQFHQRSTKKVMGIMKSLPQRPATDSEKNVIVDLKKRERHKALTQDFLKLFKELQEEGLFKPSLPHVALRLFEIAFFFFLGFTCYKNGSDLSMRIFACLSVALSIGRAGWVEHEGGHHSLTGHPKIDRFIQTFIYGFLFGLSGSWWISQHSRHHAMPQHIKHDVDLKTLPLLAFHRKVVRTAKNGKGFFVQNQKWLFLAVDTMLVGMFWRMYLHPKYCLHKGKYLDLFFMVSHYWLIYLSGFINFLVVAWLVSCYLFGNFTLSHTHLPVTSEPTHWVEYSLCHTANVRSSWWVDYWMGNLNYQIEHHLFPTMPQFRNKLCRDRVKALAKKHNLPYNLMSYKEAVVITYENMSTVSKELALDD